METMQEVKEAEIFDSAILNQNKSRTQVFSHQSESRSFKETTCVDVKVGGDSPTLTEEDLC